MLCVISLLLNPKILNYALETHLPQIHNLVL